MAEKEVSEAIPVPSEGVDAPGGSLDVAAGGSLDAAAGGSLDAAAGGSLDAAAGESLEATMAGGRSDPTSKATIGSAPANGKVKPPKNAKKKDKAAKKEKDFNKPAQQKKSKEGMESKKEEDFAQWFKELITKAELIDYYDISGCYVLRPRSYAIWDTIRDMFDKSIKQLGVQNCYFPLFVSADRLEKEQNHVEGFQAEVAWVTKSGKKELEEPIAVRPTSETIMYPAFSKWIRSYRDLPMKINQWSNVVRWEMSHCTPFLRSREFLWQEGHTAHPTLDEAGVEVLQILDLYKSVYEDLLAVPVIQGTKTETEKFAGSLYTTTVEGFIPGTGRAIQGATSHCLGQNFAKMFDIKYENHNREMEYVWQNSWGITTRTIGVMIMVHSDNKGLVLPPRVAPLELVVVPVLKKDMKEAIIEESIKLGDELKAAGLKVKVDARTDKTSGWKCNEYELSGVCFRLELGMREIENKKVHCVRRDNNDKFEVSRESAADELKAALEKMQTEMLEKARAELYSRIVRVSTWEEFMTTLAKEALALCPWCEKASCEEDVKQRSKKDSEKSYTTQMSSDGEALSGHAKSLCVPFEKELEKLGGASRAAGEKCFACEDEAKTLVLFGRSY